MLCKYLRLSNQLSGRENLNILILIQITYRRGRKKKKEFNHKQYSTVHQHLYVEGLTIIMPSKGRFNPNRASISSGLDRKVETYVRRLVEERSTEKNGTDDRAVRLPVSQVYQYVQGADPSFQRIKKQQLEKSIDKALALLKAEEDDEGDVSFDSDFEGLQEDMLMEVKVGSYEVTQFNLYEL